MNYYYPYFNRYHHHHHHHHLYGGYLDFCSGLRPSYFDCYNGYYGNGMLGLYGGYGEYYPGYF